jgi:hypothetical protein
MPAPRPARPRRSGGWSSDPTRGTRCRRPSGSDCVLRRTRRDIPPAARGRRKAGRRRRCRPARYPSPRVRDRSAPPARRPNRPVCARCGTATARARSCAAWESRRCPGGSRRTPRPAPPAPARGTDRRAARQHQPRRTSSGDHHRVPGHRRTPAGITPPARRAPATAPRPPPSVRRPRATRTSTTTHAFRPSHLRGFRLRPALCGTTGGLKQAPGALYIGSGRRGPANRTGHGSFGPGLQYAPALPLAPIHRSA